MRLEQSAHAAGKKKVAIVGGGFAGLNAAKRSANAPSVHVILVDQRNHHLFQPLLYEVATAGTQPGGYRGSNPRTAHAGVERRGSPRARRGGRSRGCIGGAR
jgi:flavin-dependent dehydrogenase